MADELGCNKIALGHHRDDILETFFLNMFFGGKLKGMPAKLVSDDGKHMVIRPMAYVKEADSTRYAEVKQFPIIPCDLCGSQENLQRKQIKGMMREWEKKYPGRVREHLLVAVDRGAVAPDGPRPVRLQGPEDRWRGQSAGRHRVRRGAVLDAGDGDHSAAAAVR